MARFPFGIGKSWYPVAYSDELVSSEVVALRYFETDLVLSRDDDGCARVVDRDGGRPWHVHEGAGVISVWYDDVNGAPEIALPNVAEWGHAAWASSYWKYRWTVRTHPQEMHENAIDWVHFRYVHGGSDRAPIQRHAFDALTMTYSIEAPPERDPKRRDAVGFAVHGEVHGLGWSVTRFTGAFEVLTLTALTPIDRETTDVRSAFLVKRAVLDDPARLAGMRALIDAHARGIEQDIPIWENKIYRAAPLLVETDGPIAEFRRWAAQFYRTRI